MPLRHEDVSNPTKQRSVVDTASCRVKKIKSISRTLQNTENCRLSCHTCNSTNPSARFLSAKFGRTHGFAPTILPLHQLWGGKTDLPHMQRYFFRTGMQEHAPYLPHEHSSHNSLLFNTLPPPTLLAGKAPYSSSYLSLSKHRET